MMQGKIYKKNEKSKHLKTRLTNNAQKSSNVLEIYKIYNIIATEHSSKSSTENKQKNHYDCTCSEKAASQIRVPFAMIS